LLPLVIAANDDCRGAIEKNVVAILEAHAVDDNADTSALEAEIDEKGYDLYGLTPEEREIVEAAVKR